VDAVHAAPHLPIDVQALGTDFLACSVYKFFGPHVGVLYGRREALDALPTYKLRPADDRFETGTGNFEGIAGARAAVEYIAEVGRRFGAPFAARFPGMTGRRLEAHAGMAAIRAYEMPLFERLLDGLEAIPGARVWGITDRVRFAERTPTAAVTLPGVTAEAAATALGDRGIATWWGDFYATGLIERLGLAPEGVLRIGLTHYNTTAEVDRLLDELRRIAAAT
jgi:selenocysteine lyase/cysteine desulfurase